MLGCGLDGPCRLCSSLPTVGMSGCYTPIADLGFYQLLIRALCCLIALIAVAPGSTRQAAFVAIGLTVAAGGVVTTEAGGCGP
ncbi:UNVERIFIED_CONTAM: hypothetical protein Slati_2234600 [Sesamum latifolium]|uniref:Uncharacterized protein n=1 Tax=Sesamum latifolium TaxID=2727402 RepID=A0AAW2WTK9_9LAMI